jgi:arylsulfatase A-like enzyme
MLEVGAKTLILSRLSHLAAYALALGVLLGAGLTWIELRLYTDVRDVLWLALADAMRLGVGLSVLATAVWAPVFLFARRGGAGRASRLATLVAYLPPLAWFALHLNREVLPDFLDSASLMPNAALAVGGLVVCEGLSRGLRHGMETSGHALWVGVVAALLAVIPVAAHVGGHTGQRESTPDVLFLLLDVARADHLSCYGYERPTSPHLDRLAEDSILFENAISSSTFTKTSISTLFTGLNAHHHGVYLGSFGKNPAVVESDTLGGHFTTLAEAMYDAGRSTAAWVQNGQLRAFLGFDQGFSIYHDQAGRAGQIADSFIAWHRRWGERTPYFAYLHFIELHAPYQPPAPHRGKFGSVSGDLSDQMGDASWYDFKEGVLAGRIELSQEDLDGFEARYDELIAHLDDWVGRIIDELKASGRYDDTLIVVTADHGEGFWEHGFISHSTVPYEELVHVPLILKMPRSVGAGRRVERMVGVIDLMPTLLELVGAPVPDGVEGRSFLPLLAGDEEALDPSWLTLEFRAMLGVRTERWKYLHVPGRPPELYDLEADPLETTNCIGDHADVAARLEQAVQRSIEIRKSATAAERVVLDGETVEALEALGYL